MDGKGCWRDNVLIERLWKTIKYQEVYLKAYESASDARANIRRFIDFYNSVRGHSSLQGQPPDSIYFSGPCNPRTPSAKRRSGQPPRGLICE